jgi:hypothetical protein
MNKSVSFILAISLSLFTPIVSAQDVSPQSNDPQARVSEAPSESAVMVRTVVVHEREPAEARPVDEVEQARLNSSWEQWRPDTYLGFFWIFDPTDPHNLQGGDIRLSLPIAELTEWLAVTMSVELGAVYGRGGHAGRWRVADVPLGVHGALTLGLRTRTGPLSVGLRGGYSPWFSGAIGFGPTGPSVNINVAHAGLVGAEVGLGLPEITITGSIDLHAGEGGLLMPLVGIGLCF